MEQAIKTFGIWQVTEDGMNSTEPYEYNMGVDDIFAYREEDGVKVWDFPLHLTEKTWLQDDKAHHLQEFNQAFRFAQDYFKGMRPERAQDVSDDYTWRVQQQLVDARARWRNR